MIVVYAQARGRQGVDAAIDGAAVDVDDARFIDMRQKSMNANLRREAARADRVVVHRGEGIVRLQIDESSTEDLSRLIVVLPSLSLRGHREGLLRSIVESASVIDRNLRPKDLDVALELASRVVGRSEKAKLVAAVLTLGLLALGLGTAVAIRKVSR